MKPEDELCLCFHVTQRKVANYIRLERPRHVSQLADCYGAGTGCGWCRPFLKKMFEAEPGRTTPPNYPTPTTTPRAGATTSAKAKAPRPPVRRRLGDAFILFHSSNLAGAFFVVGLTKPAREYCHFVHKMGVRGQNDKSPARFRTRSHSSRNADSKRLATLTAPVFCPLEHAFVTVLVGQNWGGGRCETREKPGGP